MLFILKDNSHNEYLMNIIDEAEYYGYWDTH